jgi:hypothetical protein
VLHDTAREVQSDMRRLDRSLRELEAEFKKLEKHLHTLSDERAGGSSVGAAHADDDFVFDQAPLDARAAGRTLKLLATMRSLADTQPAAIEKILANIAVLERHCPPPSAVSSPSSGVTVTAAALPSSASAATAAVAGSSASSGSKTRTKRDAAVLSSPAPHHTPEPSSDADLHLAKKARSHVGQKGMHSADAPPREGELVAARDARSEGYLLAKVLQYLPTKQKYNVEDADPTISPDTTRRTFMCGLNEISALRKPDNEYKATSRVLAMFPETSMFYHAVVIEPPSVNENSRYLVRFEDDEDEDTGQTPLREISPRDVVRAKS